LGASQVGAASRRLNHRPRKYIKSEFTISFIDQISLDLANVNTVAAMPIESLMHAHFRGIGRSNNNKERQA
jgi:hypothetical protein